MVLVASVPGISRRTGVSISAQAAIGPSTATRSSSTTVPVLRARIETTARPPGSAATVAGESVVATLSVGREAGRMSGRGLAGLARQDRARAGRGIDRGGLGRGAAPAAPHVPQKRASGSGTRLPQAAQVRKLGPPRRRGSSTGLRGPHSLDDGRGAHHPEAGYGAAVGDGDGVGEGVGLGVGSGPPGTSHPCPRSSTLTRLPVAGIRIRAQEQLLPSLVSR